MGFVSRIDGSTSDMTWQAICLFHCYVSVLCLLHPWTRLYRDKEINQETGEGAQATVDDKPNPMAN